MAENHSELCCQGCSEKERPTKQPQKDLECLRTDAVAHAVRLGWLMLWLSGIPRWLMIGHVGTLIRSALGVAELGKPHGVHRWQREPNCHPDPR
jgi:hypothetical protein